MLRLSRTMKEITEWMTHDVPFVLVDDEHIRSLLSHSRAMPFLEKDGHYWGPPPDDITAIRELDRMRAGGARFIVFVWTTFWWLGYYAEFERHLRSRFDCVRENDSVVIFDLAQEI